MYKNQMKGVDNGAEIRGIHSIRTEIPDVPRRETNPVFRDMAHHIKEHSISHGDFMANVCEVVHQSVMIFDQQITDLNERIFENDQTIEILNAKNESMAKEKEEIFSQIDNLKKLFA